MTSTARDGDGAAAANAPPQPSFLTRIGRHCRAVVGSRVVHGVLCLICGIIGLVGNRQSGMDFVVTIVIWVAALALGAVSPAIVMLDALTRRRLVRRSHGRTGTGS